MRRVFLLSAVLTVTACVTTTHESYRSVQDRNVDIAYVAASAEFNKYRSLMLADEMGIYFPTHVTPSEQDLARVRNAFRTAFSEQLADYEIVQQAGPDVLGVRASLVDLRGTAADRLPQLSSDINEILRAGKLTFIMELVDSQTGNSLVRAADTERSPKIDLPEDGSADDSEVRAAADHWAGLFRAFLDENLGEIE